MAVHESGLSSNSSFRSSGSWNCHPHTIGGRSEDVGHSVSRVKCSLPTTMDGVRMPPTANQSVKICHFADVHATLDTRHEVLRVLNHIVQTAIEEKCDAAVMSGDLWDRKIDNVQGTFPGVVEAFRHLLDHMPLVMVYGNAVHDVPGSLDIFRHLGGKHPCWVSDKPQMVLYHLLEKRFIEITDDTSWENGILFSCMPYPTVRMMLGDGEVKTDDGDPSSLARTLLVSVLEAMGVARANIPSPAVFVGHVTIEGVAVGAHQYVLAETLSVTPQELQLAFCDMYALGHIHQPIQKVLARYPRIIYSGSMFHKSFGEPEDKSHVIATVWQGRDPKVKRVSNPSRPILLLEKRQGQYSSTEIQLTDQERELLKFNPRIRLRLYPGDTKTAALVTPQAISSYLNVLGWKGEDLALEVVPTPTRTQARVPELEQAQTLAEKLEAWAVATNRQLTPSVHEKATWVQTDVVPQKVTETMPVLPEE